MLGGGAEPDLLAAAAAARSADGDAQVFSSQPRDDLQHGLSAAAQVAILVQTPSVPIQCSRGGNLYIWKKSALMETRILALLMRSTRLSTASFPHQQGW